jgi:hypothetical protein
LQQRRVGELSPQPASPHAFTFTLAFALATLCMVSGALGWAWEFFARQAPSSPWNVRGFPDEIARFALHAWIDGLALAILAPRTFASTLVADTGRAWALLAALALGVGLSLPAFAYSARTGVLGIQLRDATGVAHTILVARLAGESLLFLALVIALVANARTKD